MAEQQQNPLPDDAGLRAVRKLVTEFTEEMKAHRYARVVENFDGDPNKFKGWIRQIEKYALLTGKYDDRQGIAYQKSKGVVKDVMQRLASGQPHGNWERMKFELTKRFAPIPNPIRALALLREIRQMPGENARVLSERLLDLAEEASESGPGDQMHAPLVEKQLVGFFIDALRDDHLKLKILRDNSGTLERAVELATRDQTQQEREASNDEDDADTQAQSLSRSSNDEETMTKDDVDDDDEPAGSVDMEIDA